MPLNRRTFTNSLLKRILTRMLNVCPWWNIHVSMIIFTTCLWNNVLLAGRQLIENWWSPIRFYHITHTNMFPTSIGLCQITIIGIKSMKLQPSIFVHQNKPILDNTASLSKNIYIRLYAPRPTTAIFNGPFVDVQIFLHHDDVINWTRFTRYWLFVREIHQWQVNCSYKGQWCGALMFSLIFSWTNGWANSRYAGDLKRNRDHCDVTVLMGGSFLTA